MITINEFKEIFDSLDATNEPEIALEFENESYILVKHIDKLTFGKDNTNEVYEFKDLNHLWSGDVNGFKLRDNWDRIKDILLDLTFSIKERKQGGYEK